MNTKEAITMLRGYVSEAKFMPTKKVHKIINLLERGKKYKAMWEEVEESSHTYDDWESLDLDKLEQKYFPKE